MKLFSFIQFNSNQHLNQNAKIGYFDSILLNPAEWYTQIFNIALSDKDLQLVDLCGNVLQNVLYFRNGQYYEFRIGAEYYEPVRFKIIIEEVEYFSNPFSCYENVETLRIDYKNQDLYQSIRLNAYFTNIDNESNVSTYVEQFGNKISGYSTITTKKNYLFNKTDNFTFLATNQALAYPIVYVNNERVTDKPLLKTSEILGASNLFKSQLEACVDIDDVYNFSLQIAPPLQLINAVPQGIYTLESFENNFELEFNHDVTESVGQIQLFKDNDFFANLFVKSIVDDDVKLIFTDDLDFTNGVYKWVIPAGKFNSIFGTHSEIIINFEIRNADFDNKDFNNEDFFTN